VSAQRLPLAVVDMSALMAILEAEPSQRAFEDGFLRCDELRMSAATHLELSLVVRARKGEAGLLVLDQLLRAFAILIEPFDEAPHLSQARAGAIQFGKGFHPAALNLGDLFSYATAMSLQAPLFFQGFDFGRTDVREAMAELGYPFDDAHRPIPPSVSASRQ
jgi:ribonuclease VapC